MTPDEDTLPLLPQAWKDALRTDTTLTMQAREFYAVTLQLARIATALERLTDD